MDSVTVVPRLQSPISIDVLYGLSCSAACEIFQHQGLNLCLLHQQGDTFPLRDQRNSGVTVFFSFKFFHLVLLPVAIARFQFCTLATNFTRSISIQVKLLNVEFLLGLRFYFLFFFPGKPNEQLQKQEESAPYTHHCLLETSVSLTAKQGEKASATCIECSEYMH